MYQLPDCIVTQENAFFIHDAPVRSFSVLRTSLADELKEKAATEFFPRPAVLDDRAETTTIPPSHRPQKTMGSRSVWFRV
jgi:hypothetical protein